MKTRLILIVLIIVSIFTINALAQNKDKDKGKSKSKEKVKIQVTGLPKQMNAGETVAFTVTIKNTSKKTELNTGGISFETSGNYTVSPSVVPAIVLQPKERTDLTFNLTAPFEQGKSKFKITFYNDGKKAGTKTRNIRIGEGFIKTNDDDDDDNRNNDDDGKDIKGKKEKAGDEGTKEKDNDDDGKGDDSSKNKNKGNEGTKEKNKGIEGSKEKEDNKNKNK